MIYITKRVFVFCLLLLLLINFLAVNALAVEGLSDLEGSLEEGAGSAENAAARVREFTERDKWDFLGEKWREILLKNKFILGVDEFFSKINFVFVVLFGRGWDLSLEMLFVFMLWLFTILWVYKIFLVSYSKGLSILYSFLGIVIMSQLKVFKFVGDRFVRLILFKQSFWWSAAMSLFLIVFLFVYLLFGRYLADRLKKKKKKNREDRLEYRVKVLEALEGADELQSK